MQIINFSHPLTDEQLDQIAKAAHVSREEIKDPQTVKVQLDQQEPIVPQVAAIVAQVSPAEYESKIYVILPGLSLPAVMIASALKERGKVVAIRLKPKSGVVATGYDFAEFVEL